VPKRSPKPKPKPAKKPTALARVAPAPQPEQIEQVRQWLIDGHRDHSIIESTRTTWPEWSADPMPLISAALDQIAKSADFDSATLAGWCFEATKDVHRRMIESGDYAGALRAIRQLADMAAKQPPPDLDSPPAEAPA
jgi:hypothetical protein